jgi:hypothetical protein
MTVLALASAKGAPGVTTTALALTLAWPKPVLLVEADASGSSSILAGYMAGSVPHDRSIVGLIRATRAGQSLDDALWRLVYPLGDDGPNTSRGLLAAPQDSAQAVSLRGLWPALPGLWRRIEEQHGVDVIIDAGRFGAANEPTPLLDDADLAVVVTRTSLPDIAALAARLEALPNLTAPDGREIPKLHLLLVGEGRPYTGREIGKRIPVPVAGAMPMDPRAAAVLSHGVGAGAAVPNTALMRAAVATAQRLDALALRRRALLAPQSRTEQTETSRVQ